jgi:hypothetical protein
MNQFPPSPREFHYDRLKFFQNFAEILASQGLPLVSTTPVANFATSFPSVFDTGGKFATGLNNTGRKLPPVSTTPVAISHRYQRHGRQICHRCLILCGLTILRSSQIFKLQYVDIYTEAQRGQIDTCFLVKWGIKWRIFV